MTILLLQGLFALVVVYFAIYVILEFRLILLSRKCEQARLIEVEPRENSRFNASNFPKISVFLPVYNESLVIERLIDAVCRLEYPTGSLEILVLDDSTDQTTFLAKKRVAFYAENGVDIKLIRRDDRAGFKAGNLANGMRLSKGEFLAIFDADFTPPPDFLLTTIPCFEDEAVGYLQTGIGYINRDASFLTKFQAMIMGHQQYVTVGLSNAGLMGALSGSSCVWRRQCVESLGGWNAETITEDVDLGYRAQFDKWTYAYLPNVVSLSELPESMSALRVQRDRWARGLIHNAFKHLPRMFNTKMSLEQKLYAVSSMFSSLLLAAFFVLILLSLPLALMSDQLGLLFHFNSAGFLLVLTVWIFSNFVGSQKGGRFSRKGSLLRKLANMYAYVAMFLPLSLYYFSAGLQVLVGSNGAFNRTPKGHDGRESEVPRISNILRVIEALVFLYSGASLIIAISQNNFWLIPFNFTVCFGFAMVLYFSWKESRAHAAG